MKTLLSILTVAALASAAEAGTVSLPNLTPYQVMGVQCGTGTSITTATGFSDNGAYDSSLTLTNADGTVDATNLDSLQLVPLDATTLAVTATATFRDGNSDPFRIAFVDLTLFDDGATLSVLDGSLSLITP